MGNRCKCATYAVVVLAAVVFSVFGAGEKAADENLWPPERIAQAVRALQKMKTDSLVTEAQFLKKRAMLEQRRAGTFKPTALSSTNPAEVNFIQNGGFEEINRNSAPNRSRWLWWNGWDWGGDYENFWAAEKENVHSGAYSAGIRCKGNPGRIGIFTPRLPIVPGATEYVFSIWAKGEGDNELFLNFESGATGTLREKVGSQWTQITLKGAPEKGAKEFTFFIYSAGRGTIYLDDAKLVPVGGTMDEE
jgi:hypothetical protein